MADQKIAPQQDPSGIGSVTNIMSLLSQLTGTKSTDSTSGGTVTTQTQVNVQDMMKQLLEGSGSLGFGRNSLAQTLQSGRKAGVYGNRALSLDLNDLLSRVTAEASIAGAPRTETKSGTTVTKKTAGAANYIGAGTLGLGAAGLLAMSPSLRKQLGIDELLGGDTVTGAINGVRDLLGMNPAGAWGPEVGNIAAGNMASSYSFLGDAANMGATADFGVSQLTSANDYMAGLGGASDMGAPWEMGDMAGGAGTAGEFGLSDALPYLPAVMELVGGDAGRAAETAGGIYAGQAIGNIIAPGIGGVIGGAIGGFVSDVIDDVCFITTAVCTAQGMDDNCDELVTLRKFRDTWLTENYPEEIQEYYEVAPPIVTAISSMGTAGARIWATVYKQYILPAVAAIEAGENEQAYEIYKDMVMTLKGCA